MTYIKFYINYVQYMMTVKWIYVFDVSLLAVIVCQKCTVRPVKILNKI